ncbi:MAG TPA: lipid biosynthesis B12-binding/radical SAM protein, partial [bacterium]|nr:lipid biosynthesis B12-binding/radical SAM protein [bacterium]
MKFLLISANTCTEPYPVYPLALTYLSTALRNEFKDMEIVIYDVNIHGGSDLGKFVSELRPDFTGISLRNIDNVNLYNGKNYINDYRELVKTVKNSSNSVVIAGGAGFSIYPEKLFAYLGCDLGVCGEGESTLVELVKALKNKSDLSGIEGLVHLHDGKVVVNKRTGYFKGISFDIDEKLSDFYWTGSGMMNIQTKRGCPYHCVYCSYPVIEGRTVRMLDPESVVTTIEKSVARGLDYFFFTDSVFNMNADYNRQLAELIIKRGISVKWGAYFRPAGTTFEDLELYKKSGLTHIEFGTESFSDKVLKSYGKEFSFQDIKNYTEMCRELKIYNAHFLILGGYGETEQTLAETFERSKELPWTVFFPFIGMRIYPHTPLYKICLNESVITADDDLMQSKYYLAKDVDLSNEKLKAAALATGRKWVFPDEDHSKILKKMKSRGKRGPLWE